MFMRFDFCYCIVCFSILQCGLVHVYNMYINMHRYLYILHFFKSVHVIILYCKYTLEWF